MIHFVGFYERAAGKAACGIRLSRIAATASHGESERLDEVNCPACVVALPKVNDPPVVETLSEVNAAIDAEAAEPEKEETWRDRPPLL